MPQSGVQPSLSASLDHNFISQDSLHIGGVFFLVIPTIQVILIFMVTEILFHKLALMVSEHMTDFPYTEARYTTLITAEG